MAKALKKEMLAGRQRTETVVLFQDENGEDVGVEIRPLNHIEGSEIQGIIGSAYKIDVNQIGKKKIARQNIQVDSEKLAIATAKAQLKAAALGTVDPEWNEKTINEQWEPDWIKKVGRRVMEISGIRTDEEDDEAMDAETFREE